MTKNWRKKLPREKKFNFFYIKLQFTKEAIQHFKTWNFIIFFYFCKSFLPSWIRSDHWPDESGSESGSATLFSGPPPGGLPAQDTLEGKGHCSHYSHNYLGLRTWGSTSNDPWRVSKEVSGSGCVPLLACLRLWSILGVFHHVLSVFSIFHFRSVHGFCTFYPTGDHGPSIHRSACEEFQVFFCLALLFSTVQRKLVSCDN